MWLRTRKCQIDWKEPANPLWGSWRRKRICTLGGHSPGHCWLPPSLFPSSSLPPPSLFPPSSLFLVSAVWPYSSREPLVEWEPGLHVLEGDNMNQCPLPPCLKASSFRPRQDWNMALLCSHRAGAMTSLCLSFSIWKETNRDKV